MTHIERVDHNPTQRFIVKLPCGVADIANMVSSAAARYQEQFGRGITSNEDIKVEAVGDELHFSYPIPFEEKIGKHHPNNPVPEETNG